MELPEGLVQMFMWIVITFLVYNMKADYISCVNHNIAVYANLTSNYSHGNASQKLSSMFGQSLHSNINTSIPPEKYCSSLSKYSFFYLIDGLTVLGIIIASRHGYRAYKNYSGNKEQDKTT